MISLVVSWFGVIYSNAEQNSWAACLTLQLAASDSEMKGMEAMLTFLFYSFGSLAISLLQETAGSDFNDLGKKLLEGFALAVVCAIAYTFIKLRRRDRNPQAAFISITATPATDAAVNPKTEKRITTARQ